MTSIFKGDVFRPPTLPDGRVPGSGDDNFRRMRLIQPFVDPPNSFRARTVNDLTFIVPERTEFSTLQFDVGLDPRIDPIIFSIQNRCLNTTLRVKLTLPQFLRSNLGTEFLIPAIGDSDTPPILYYDRESRVGPAIGERSFTVTDFAGAVWPTVPEVAPLPTGAGKGLINVTLTFSEAQAKTLNPDIYNEKIIFDIFPNAELTGPIFIGTLIGKPANLNLEPELEFPIDDSEPIVTGSVDPPVLTITESIEVEKLVPIPTLGFLPGADGVTNDGVKFLAGGDLVEGPPPTGWITQADGRSYPPIILDPVCDPVTVDGPDGIRLEDIPEEERTLVQSLLLGAKDRPPTFGSLNVRRGFVIEPRPFLMGDARNRALIERLGPQAVVADFIPGRPDFKIIVMTPEHRDEFRLQVRKELDLVIAAVKEGNRLGRSFLGTKEQQRLWFETNSLLGILNDGKRLGVNEDQNTAAELQLHRVVAPAASILFQLKNG